MTARLKEWVIYLRARSAALLYRMGMGMTPMAMGDREPVQPKESTPLPTQPTTLAAKTPVAASPPRVLPRITEFVHFESFGHPTGEAKACRPAVVVEIVDGSTTEELVLAVFRTNGLLFEQARHEEDNHLGGTWHHLHD